MSQADAPEMDADGAAVSAACRRLHAAIDGLDQAAADLLGVSRTDLRCLNLLEHGPLSPSRIAAALGITAGSVTALVDRLEAKGLVKRARTPGDRRGVLVSATPLVFRSIGELYRSCAMALHNMAMAYPPGERASAVRHLGHAAEAWEAAAKSMLGPKNTPTRLASDATDDKQ
jgi:DNA-binding MarR family transcriptional regulator